jgi:hypothetical protein
MSWRGEKEKGGVGVRVTCLVHGFVHVALTRFAEGV